MEQNLHTVFEDKTWAAGTAVPRSGPGSTLDATGPLREALPGLLARHGIKRFVDAPCGDWFWMQHVDLGEVDYLGADISASVIDANRRAYERDGVRFAALDITADPLPPSDLLMCRDCLFHLSFDLRWRFFENFARSEVRLLLLTVNHIPRNREIEEVGAYRAFDPMLAPFHLPEPIERIWETRAEALAAGQSVPEGAYEKIGGRPRSLGLWSQDQIQQALAARQSAAAHK